MLLYVHAQQTFPFVSELLLKPRKHTASLKGPVQLHTAWSCCREITNNNCDTNVMIVISMIILCDTPERLRVTSTWKTAVGFYHQ